MSMQCLHHSPIKKIKHHYKINNLLYMKMISQTIAHRIPTEGVRKEQTLGIVIIHSGLKKGVTFVFYSDCAV